MEAAKISLNIEEFSSFSYFRDLFFNSDSDQREELSKAQFLMVPRKKCTTYGTSMVFLEKKVDFHIFVKIETSNSVFLIFLYGIDLFFKFDFDELK